MRYGDAEFHALMERFESDARKVPGVMLRDLTRVPRDEYGTKVPTGVFYQNGETNQAFVMYMAGYQFGRTEERLSR